MLKRLTARKMLGVGLKKVMLGSRSGGRKNYSTESPSTRTQTIELRSRLASSRSHAS